MLDWKTRKAKALVLQSLRMAWPLFRSDVAQRFPRLAPLLAVDGTPSETDEHAAAPGIPSVAATGRPRIYISACVDAQTPGGWKYNGGIKEFNLLVKTLRSKGYEAWIVTFDGEVERWLIDHQPVISIAELDRRIASGEDARFVTSWMTAQTYLSRLDKFYLWDMELRYTSNDHLPLLFAAYRDGRIVKTAGISRTIQSWHMTQFGESCTVIPNQIDMDIWSPDASRRIPGRIGYMDEGPHSETFVSRATAYLASRGIHHSWLKIAGDEDVYLELTRSCDLFVSMNTGKDPFWGEGCPRPIIESMAAGCVNLSFDILGNREVVIPHLNAVLVPEKSGESLGETIESLLKDRPRIEAIRERCREYLQTCHTPERRWPAIKAFLDL